MILKPKGTQDILPSQVYKWNYVESVFKKICTRYGFKEMRTPIFEYTELFKRGVGDTTDIVQKEMYSFKDMGKRDITLKPEGTTPFVRAFIENKLYADTQPTKLFYITPCFRQENTQAGRYRQFHQFGIEIFGSDSPMADAEVIGVAADLFEALGIKNLEIRINSIGCPKCRSEYRKALQNFLREKVDLLCHTCKGRYEKNPMRILDCKNETCQEYIIGAPRMIDYLCEDCSNDFKKLQEILDSMEIVYSIDPGIVRGLDYYSKTAFEIVSNNIGAQGTVCGGGRYDNLIEEVGGPSIPGVGFGLGIERLLLVMDSNNIVIPDENGTDIFIAVMGERAGQYGVKLLRKLRSNGIVAQMDLMHRNIKGQFKYADKLDAKYTVVIGDSELDQGIISVKEMKTSEQKTMPIDELLEFIKK